MTSTTNRELLALRAYLVEALTPTDVTRIGMHTVANAAAPALARGWTGRELGALAVAGIYDGTIDNPGAYIVAGLRDLGTVDPPREVTPTAPPVAAVLGEMHGRNNPAADPGAWIQRIRGGVA